LAEAITDEELEAEAIRLEEKAPLPLKMAAMAVFESQLIKANFAHSSLPIDAQPEYVEKRRQVDFWTARWKSGNNGLAGPLAIDLNKSLSELDSRPTTPIGRIFWAGVIFGAPAIYLIMAWWRWWLS
jgi:hypothetical protein